VISPQSLAIDAILHSYFRRVMPVAGTGDVAADAPRGAGHIARHYRLRTQYSDERLSKRQSEQQ
jgi:hypothetical protein